MFGCKRKTISWNMFLTSGLRFKLISQTPLNEILPAAQPNDITTDYNRKKTPKTPILNYCSHHPLIAQSSYNLGTRFHRLKQRQKTWLFKKKRRRDHRAANRQTGLHLKKKKKNYFAPVSISFWYLFSLSKLWKVILHYRWLATIFNDRA